MATLNGLPVFKITINESLENKTGIDFISLVDYPAIETNWVAMAEKKPLKFAFNSDKKLLYGPALIPDLPIYRFDAKMGEYFVVFTKEEIQKIVRKFQKQNKNLNLNYQHQPNSQIDAVIQEIWLTSKTDKSQDFGFNLPEGSAFVVTYVEDDKFWNEQVKTGNVKGYSIEGFLDMEFKKQNMSDLKFIEAKTTDGMMLKTSSESWAVGADVILVNAEGQESPAEGEYTLDNGTVIKCMGGKVTEIVESEAELTEPEAEAMRKLFSKLLKPMEDKIAELEIKLSKIPAAPAATVSTDNEGKTPTATETALSKVLNLRKITKK